MAYYSFWTLFLFIQARRSFNVNLKRSIFCFKGAQTILIYFLGDFLSSLVLTIFHFPAGCCFSLALINPLSTPCQADSSHDYSFQYVVDTAEHVAAKKKKKKTLSKVREVLTKSEVKQQQILNFKGT